MKILLELPTWLGDAVMATPAIESLLAHYKKAQITLFGTYASTEALKAHPRVTQVVVDRTKEGFRLYNLYRTAKALGPHDLALSFRSHLASKLLLKLTQSTQTYQYKKTAGSRHQVARYQAFVDHVTGQEESPGPLRLYWPRKTFAHPTIGINPGATYGSAKRWYPDKFADVAAHFASRYDIVIFGGPKEVDIAMQIETHLRKKGITNAVNLAGQTTIPELCSTIGGCELFVTGDSGPMHIAAAYRVPTVAIFGPTKHLETSPWAHPGARIVRHDLACAPCMKRTCPLKHHACMREISADEVIEAATRLLV